MKWLEVGQARAVEVGDPYETGLAMGRDARRDLKGQLQMALVFCTPEAGPGALLRGIQDSLGSDAPPQIGCTTPFPIASDGSTQNGAVLTLLAARADHLHVAVGVGERVFNDPKCAVEAALDGTKVIGALRDGRHGLLLVITPGFEYQTPVKIPGRTVDQTLIKLIAERLGEHVPLFGGSAADCFQRYSALEFVNYHAYQNSVGVAFVETSLTVSSRFHFGLNPDPDNRFCVNSFVDAVPSGQRVAKINGQPAWEFVKSLEAGEPPCPVVFAVADDVNGFHLARPYQDPEVQSAAFFQRPLTKYVSLRAAHPDRSLLLDAACRAASDAFDVNRVRQPAFALAVSCAGRPDLFGPGHRAEFVAEEITSLCRGLPDGVSLTGFYGFGEHSISVSDRTAGKTYAVGVLALGSDLTPPAQLLEKLRTIAEISADIQWLVNERDIALKVLGALNDVGYFGGMISFVAPAEHPEAMGVIRAAYALNAKDVTFARWEEIQNDTVRELTGSDLLSLVASKELESPVVVSSRDLRCHAATIAKGEIPGQIVFRLDDPYQPDKPFGTLQIGIPDGNQPSTIELEALKTFARLAAQCLASDHARTQFRIQLQRFYELGRAATSGAHVERLLMDVVEAAFTYADADWASLQLADLDKQRLYFRTVHPPDSRFWTTARRKLTAPFQRRAQDRAPQWAASWAYEHGEPYRSNERDRPLLTYHLHPEIVGELCVPIKIGDDTLGVLSVYNRSRHFQESDEYHLTHLARIAAVAVVCARAQVEAEALRQVSELFLHPDSDMLSGSEFEKRLQHAARIVCETVEATMCSIFLTDHESASFLVLRATTDETFRTEIGKARYCFREGAAEGLTGGVALLQKPLRLMEVRSPIELAEDYPEFTAAGVIRLDKYRQDENLGHTRIQFLAVPILWEDAPNSGKKTVGVIRCMVAASQQIFSYDDEKLLCEVAGLLAIGLRRAYVAEQAAGRAEWREYANRVLRHQLLSPLAVTKQTLSRYVQELVESISESSMAPSVEPLSKCVSDLDKAHRLIEDIHLLGEIGDLSHLVPSTINMRILVNRAIEQAQDELRLKYRSSKIPRIHATLSADAIRVKGFYVFLQQAIVNLLTNALKAASTDSTVTVTVAVAEGHEDPEPGTVIVTHAGACEVDRWWEATALAHGSTRLPLPVLLISVSDTGPGIAEADIGNVFQLGHSIWNRPEHKGAGLGLSIVRDTMRAHDGAVAVKTSPGQGATFTLVLPLTESAESDDDL